MISIYVITKTETLLSKEEFDGAVRSTTTSLSVEVVEKLIRGLQGWRLSVKLRYRDMIVIGMMPRLISEN